MNNKEKRTHPKKKSVNQKSVNSNKLQKSIDNQLTAFYRAKKLIKLEEMLRVSNHKAFNLLCNPLTTASQPDREGRKKSRNARYTVSPFAVDATQHSVISERSIENQTAKNLIYKKDCPIGKTIALPLPGLRMKLTIHDPITAQSISYDSHNELMPLLQAITNAKLDSQNEAYTDNKKYNFQLTFQETDYKYYIQQLHKHIVNIEDFKFNNFVYDKHLCVADDDLAKQPLETTIFLIMLNNMQRLYNNFYTTQHWLQQRETLNLPQLPPAYTFQYLGGKLKYWAYPQRTIKRVLTLCGKATMTPQALQELEKKAVDKQIQQAIRVFFSWLGTYTKANLLPSTKKLIEKLDKTIVHDGENKMSRLNLANTFFLARPSDVEEFVSGRPLTPFSCPKDAGEFYPTPFEYNTSSALFDDEKSMPAKLAITTTPFFPHGVATLIKNFFGVVVYAFDFFGFLWFLQSREWHIAFHHAFIASKPILKEKGEFQPNQWKKIVRNNLIWQMFLTSHFNLAPDNYIPVATNNTTNNTLGRICDIFLKIGKMKRTVFRDLAGITRPTELKYLNPLLEKQQIRFTQENISVLRNMFLTPFFVAKQKTCLQHLHSYLANLPLHDKIEYYNGRLS